MTKKKRNRKVRIIQHIQDFWEEAKEHKIKAFVYISLRILVVLVLVAEMFNQNYNNVFLCVLTLLLFMIPGFLNKRMNIVLPGTLEIIVLLFIFGAEILGEINEYYLLFDQWDDMLHIINGFLCAAIGFSMIDILNQNEKVTFSLSPIFVALVAFCFSMTVGVIWEFFEFGMDLFFKTDMQKDTILPMISSVIFNPEGKNVAVMMPIDSMVVNGVPWNYGGYIDIGLYDTMNDLFVNFIGAVIFSTIGYFYIKNRSKGKFAKRFMPRRKTEAEILDEQEHYEHLEHKYHHEG
ncbi:hypothetical protein [Acetobacterium woodii]|uniref:Uncharacterized protein n=1 Tax=Acetobacterium woodii (strain ATCC 29683 / DSM 1030 / JCM 2381 / KCTC 1655 / WB1) TaxID=931626 RepID=H6LFX4_ACEWD|nr:hypothetical protein [Acetobacterium woodii]AFA48262.1 hypothetical protein Awo_c14790 [Acetobacterium woodii DSM 1030]